MAKKSREKRKEIKSKLPERVPFFEIGSIVICKYGKNGQCDDYSQSYSYVCYKPATCNCEKCKREKKK